MLSRINFEDLKIHAEKFGMSGHKTRKSLVDALTARDGDPADRYNFGDLHRIRDANDADMKRVLNPDSTFVSNTDMYSIDIVNGIMVTVTNMKTGERFTSRAEFVLYGQRGNVILDSPKGEILYLNYPERS